MPSDIQKRKRKIENYLKTRPDFLRQQLQAGFGKKSKPGAVDLMEKYRDFGEEQARAICEVFTEKGFIVPEGSLFRISEAGLSVIGWRVNKQKT
jgi:hypothetical protein